ncbi:signal recognition particle subunit SRP72 [Patella vulgata]|uniref:signal recognition particle subunit SRP72 n=1 Tax=Patella vulgata TaxID=6465 RepID=UPI00217F2898|nr:signal recognition particle subunit SRP72 [Patella vulgata]
MSNKSKKTKEEPKPDKETQIQTLYGDLHRLGQKQEYAKAIKICNQILGLKGDEVSGLQYKISCQMLTDQFENALGLIQKNKITGMDFEKAYCQYRLNKTNDALKTLRAVSELDYRMKELLAQVLYRREEYEECYDLYRDLVKNSDDDFDSERQTNMAAVIASLEMWTDKTMDDPGFEEDSYEICYNKACQYIGKDDLKTAADKLKKAEDIMRADPELAEDELEEELGLIRVQQGYVLQRENKPKEASELYNLCMKSKPTDLGLLAVVSNNIVTINKDQNMFDSKKKLKAATGDNVQQKLTNKQKGCIAINQCLLNMYAGQGEQCHEVGDSLIKQYINIYNYRVNNVMN